MSKYEYILFDMDGTITDSYDAVVNSFAYALDYWGISEYDKGSMKEILGPPLRESFVKLFGFDEATALEAVAKYRERYRVHYLEEHKIYPGINELFEKLTARGYKLVLATSKPLEFATKILERHGLEGYFYFLGGASMEAKRDTKEKVLDYIFESCDIPRDKAVLVGDRCYDMAGAEYAGIDAIGVLYGYGDREELSAYKNVFLANTTEDIYDFLENGI